MTQRFGLIGWPLQHTLSPRMQQAGFDALGIDAKYEVWETETEHLVQRISSLKSQGVDGLNVTVPYKVEIMHLLDEVDAQATQVGAVNTIVVSDQKWIGYNTDISGFIKSLEVEGVSLSKHNVMVIGTGGAARAVAMAACVSGAASIDIFGRNPTAAKTLASVCHQRTGARAKGHQLDKVALATVLPNAQVIVQTTSATMNVQGESDPVTAALPWAHLAPGTVCVDIVYKPIHTSFLKTAEQHQAKTIGGLGMLLYQGAKAFELWTKERAPIQVMREALLNAVSASE